MTNTERFDWTLLALRIVWSLVLLGLVILGVDGVYWIATGESFI